MTKTPTCIDLFSGAGGLSLGLKMAGWKTLVASDYDQAACATFRRNFESVEVIAGDVRAAEWSHLKGKVDLVAGGPLTLRRHPELFAMQFSENSSFAIQPTQKPSSFFAYGITTKTERKASNPVFSCAKIEQKQLHIWVSFRSAATMARS